MSAAIQRYNRVAKLKERGGKSHKTAHENALLLLCWEAEALSEGQMAAILDIDRVTLRKMRSDAIDAGMKLAEALYPKPTARDHQ